MKSIELFIEGKYDYKFKICTWIYYMSYKNAVIKRCGQIAEEGSPTRATLYAFYKAIEKINEPCEIKVNSKIPLGFKVPKRSQNKDLIFSIQTAINKAGHRIQINIDKEFSKPNMWEQVYGTKNNVVDKTDVKTSKPSINNKNTPNDVFNIDKEKLKKEWEELLNEQHGAWVPGSGGY